MSCASLLFSLFLREIICWISFSLKRRSSRIKWWNLCWFPEKWNSHSQFDCLLSRTSLDFSQLSLPRFEDRRKMQWIQQKSVQLQRILPILLLENPAFQSWWTMSVQMLFISQGHFERQYSFLNSRALRSKAPFLLPLPLVSALEVSPSLHCITAAGGACEVDDDLWMRSRYQWMEDLLDL